MCLQIKDHPILPPPPPLQPPEVLPRSLTLYQNPNTTQKELRFQMQWEEPKMHFFFGENRKSLEAKQLWPSQPSVKSFSVDTATQIMLVLVQM